MSRPLRLNNRGFTLLEVMVVVAIIGVLSGLVVTSLRGQTVKARDARRTTDLDSIVLALQQFLQRVNRSAQELHHFQKAENP